MKAIQEVKITLTETERNILRRAIPILMVFDAEHFCFGRYGRHRIISSSQVEEEIKRVLNIAKEEGIEVDRNDINFIKFSLTNALIFFHSFLEREYSKVEPIDLGELKKHFALLKTCYNQRVYKWQVQKDECEELLEIGNDFQKAQSKSMVKYCQGQIDFFTNHFNNIKKVFNGEYSNEQDDYELLNSLHDGNRVFEVVEKNDKKIYIA